MIINNVYKSMNSLIVGIIGFAILIGLGALLANQFDGGKVYMEFKKATGITRSDLEQVGVLIYKTLTLDDFEKENCDTVWIFRKGFLSKNLFFSMFSGVVVNSWYALENKIQDERETKRGKAFMLYFEKLKIDAEKYRKDNKLGYSEMEQLHKKQLKK